MRYLRICMVFLFLLTVIGCGGNSDSGTDTTTRTVRLGDEFTLRVSERVTVEGGGVLLVELRDVVEDSRCPTDAVCVDAGQARLQVSLVSPGTGTVTPDLSTRPSGSTAVFNAFQIELRRVTPERTLASTPDKSDYEGTFVVTQVVP